MRAIINKNFRWYNIGDVSHIVSLKHNICHTFVYFGSGHPIWYNFKALLEQLPWFLSKCNEGRLWSALYLVKIHFKGGKRCQEEITPHLFQSRQVVIFHQSVQEFKAFSKWEPLQQKRILNPCWLISGALDVWLDDYVLFACN